ncbi:hypothetical protein KX928_06045 [Roseobacter sp. YSTF-M11]|uniref:Uncharacterized protein n=1 Tax=Roseobacter insulae TaxID=2859783 RepID=A0A9X1FTE8_9RHOB|nr:hypothetical protein [Roseobacter insulae]MBW4707343.1 hypothetical protein [Roseobacter insulae]
MEVFELMCQRLNYGFAKPLCNWTAIVLFTLCATSAVTAAPPAFLEYKPAKSSDFQGVHRVCKSAFQPLPTDQVVKRGQFLFYRQPTECRNAGERAFCRTIIVHRSEDLSCFLIEYTLEAIWPQTEATALVGEPNLEILPGSTDFLFFATDSGTVLLQSNKQTFSISFDPWTAPIEFDSPGSLVNE